MSTLVIPTTNVPPGDRQFGPFRPASPIAWRRVRFRFDAADFIAKAGDCLLEVLYRARTADPWTMVVGAHFVGEPSVNRHGIPVTMWGLDWSPSAADPDANDPDPQWGIHVVNASLWQMSGATLEMV